MEKKVTREVSIYDLERRPMYYGCSGTIMAALQYANPTLSDTLAYYASLMSWSFFFDSTKGIPLGIPANELMHRNLFHLYGITRNEIRRANFNELWLEIENLINRDRVAVAWVDANEVNDKAFHYNKVPGEVELMVIHGYDQKSDQLYITVNPQRFQGAIPLSCLPSILKNRVVYDYQVPEDLNVWPSSKAWGLVHFDTEAILNRQKLETIETGLYAMDLFAKEIATRIDQRDDSIYPWMEKSYAQMAFIGPQRIVSAQTLWLVADRKRSEIIGDWAQTFYRLGQSWEVTRNMFFKALNKKNASILPRIRKRVDELLANERQQAFLLRDSLVKEKSITT